MAYDHNIQWIPHNGNSAVGLAAGLHLSAAMPVAHYAEYLTPSPYLDEIITEPFKPDAEGLLSIPDKPGLGIELNREALKRLGHGSGFLGGREQGLGVWLICTASCTETGRAFYSPCQPCRGWV